jgi:DNA processing protein
MDAERAAWLRLVLSTGLGRRRARRLLAAFGSARAVLQADTPAIEAVAGAAAAEALRQPPADWPRAADDAARWLAADSRRSLVLLGEADYPALLLQTADPPLLLFTEGRRDLLQARSVAIVGSRQATPGGRETAREFAGALSGAGWTVVSGLAEGIDGAAHEGALDRPGSTVAVVGTGLDLVYPPQHSGLARRIAEQGVVISEYVLGTPPRAEHFPARNRLIAGLARGTVVVEAALRSGSLITARLAAEMGRDVFAVPGSIRARSAEGCHALLRDGAVLATSADDVLAELQGLGATRTTPAAADDVEPTPAEASDGDPLLAALGHDPVTLDALVARTGEAAGRLSVRLLELELEGRVARLPGGLFQRQDRA